VTAATRSPALCDRRARLEDVVAGSELIFQAASTSTNCVPRSPSFLATERDRPPRRPRPPPPRRARRGACGRQGDGAAPAGASIFSQT
jgi:hypothetical protein